MLAVCHAPCHDATRRLSWLSQLGWFPFPVAVVHATLFALSEGKEQHCSST